MGDVPFIVEAVVDLQFRAVLQRPVGDVEALASPLEVLAALTPAERATIVATMRAYEAALEKHPST